MRFQKLICGFGLSYFAEESGSSVMVKYFYSKGSIEWHWSFYRYCVHSKILQSVANYHPIQNHLSNG